MDSRTLFGTADILAATAGSLYSRRVVAAQARGVRGELPADRAGEVQSVVIDSRTAVPGSLFVALHGERTDGHFFVEDAMQRGALLCLVDRKFVEENEEKILALTTRYGERIIAVRDTLEALQNLARFHMRRLAGVVTIGVTGSTGKTTTKEILGSVLLRDTPGFMNQGNLNSEIGLPLSTFSVKTGHRYAIFEMGINHQGEMDILADIVHPDVAVITNIGLAHVGFLGSQDGIAAEKKRIFSHFDGGQTGFVWEDEPYFAFLSAGVNGRVVPYGARTTPGYSGSESRGLDGWALSLDGRRVKLPLVGAHNLINALCAVSVARLLGIGSAQLHAGLEAVQPLPGRGRVIRGPITIVEDSYNANPEAFVRAVAFLRDLPWDRGRKIIVAGSMKELGAASAEAHRSVGKIIRASTADAAFLFGEEMEEAYRVLDVSTMRAFWTADFEVLKQSLREYVASGDILLLKGSRAVALERLIPALQETVSPSPASGGPEC